MCYTYGMEKQRAYLAIDRLTRLAFRRWCSLLRFGESHEEEAARLRYCELVTLSNDWIRPGR